MSDKLDMAPIFVSQLPHHFAAAQAPAWRGKTSQLGNRRLATAVAYFATHNPNELRDRYTVSSLPMSPPMNLGPPTECRPNLS
jgi:hypothetical protein